MNTRSKYWCWTINNYSDEDIQEIATFASTVDVSYLVYGKETGETRTPHLQGYVELTTRKRGQWVKRRLGPEGTNPHLEARKGTGEQASTYCKKDGEFVEFGELSLTTQGSRSDLDEIRVKIADGASDLDLATEHWSQWVYHRKAFSDYRSMVRSTRSWVCDVSVRWGDTGTGKTRSVVDEEDDLWIAPDNDLEWFNGYIGQEAVLFDDFISIKNTKFGFLLKLLDRYPMQVPIKGGYVNWIPKRIYFTSNVDPKDWYTGVSARSIEALHRRITTVIHFSNLS